MKKKLLIIFLSVLLSISTFGILSMAFAEDNYFNIEQSIKQTYDLGDVVDIPAATFRISGTEYKAKHIVYFPDGSAVASNSVTLSLRGNYTVNYFITVNGETHSEEYKFSTVVPLVSYNSPKSSYIYSMNPYWDTLDGTSEYSKPTAKKLGLTASIAKNDVFRFNQIIDLNNAETENPFMEFYYMPQVFGEMDASRFYVKLTDAFDPENEVTLEYRLGLGTYSYVVGKATNQVWAGLQGKYSNGQFTGYTYHINNSYGSVIVNNAGGLHGRYGDGVQPVKFWYVSEEKALYNSYAFNGHIVDLDDEEYQSYPWNGFSSNYVYVSIWADKYDKDTMRVFIPYICGIDLSQEYVVDSIGPEITVNSNGMDIYNLPNGGVGYKYKLFDATARDLYATKPLTVGKKVLYGYNRASGSYNTESSVFIRDLDCANGYFVPDRTGVYSIVYYAYDYSGNYTEIVSNVNITAEYVDGTYLTIGDKVNTTEVGNRINLASVVDFGGYLGNYSITYSVIKDGKKVDVEGNSLTGYNFVPVETGEYTAQIVYEDLVGGGKTESYIITVVNATMPSISDEVVLPSYFISEYAYKLPALYAYDYNNNKSAVKANVKIIDGTGEREYYGGETSFVADDHGCATIIYYVSENSRSYKIPVVSVYNDNGIDVSKYFSVKEGSIEVTAQRGAVVLSSRNTDGSAEFVNKVLAKTFISEISIDSLKNDFMYLDINLSDSVNKMQKIVLSLKKEDGAASVIINGTDTGKDVKDLFSTGENFTVSYNANTNTLTVAGTKIAIDTDYYSNIFNGFDSDYIYVSYGMRGVASRSTFSISKINNQSLGADVVEDKVKPEFVLNGVYENLVVDKNTSITVWSASYGDVLSNISSETINITFNGKYITDTSGNIMKNLSCNSEYEFIVSEYGTYVISYLVKDAKNRQQGYTYVITVVDKTAPVITTDMQAKTVALGDKVTFASAKAVDNVDGNVAVYMYLIAPNYRIYDLSGEACFYIKEKGSYIVRYMAMDSEGNVAYKDFDIVVK